MYLSWIELVHELVFVQQVPIVAFWPECALTTFSSQIVSDRSDSAGTWSDVVTQANTEHIPKVVDTRRSSPITPGL